ncbi:ATP-binding cassette domain-containing protein [Candidatus Minimicrobia vallesae]|uniref:ATP-binding cassette domain-containing protein n=1 Tax=Candidatus Minimicrobia vallesae TaxID=2841264 RepID=A0A8F1MAW7_9BACT|nr:ATP-binding cassette domain-containing protein [Candidatus Minimicrobia vallesae]QWQ31730.1 ATP-binding cassette domain-containing protein [Candidatus Minimicrobia vallesae]
MRLPLKNITAWASKRSCPYILNWTSRIFLRLKKIIDEYPLTMGDNMRKIEEYTQALERFDQKGFYQIEEKIERELSNFQLEGYYNRRISSLSGGQKRLVEIVKIMHSEAHLALIDEPTNHMDYVAKQQFIDWMNSQPHQAMLIITHDRDVLGQVDRIVEIKDGQAVSYRGNYDAYLKQNAQATTAGMNNFEQIEKRIVNLKQKVLDYQRLKEKSRNPGTIQKFKRLENEARAELEELSEMEKPTFWIDKESAGQLDYKSAERYGKFKARNIRLTMKDAASRSQHVLVRAENAAVGIGERILFGGTWNIDLREGEAMEMKGRNGAGKTTLIRMMLGQRRGSDSSLSGKSMVSRTVLPDAFDLEETAGSRTAASAPQSSARAHSSLKSPPEIFRKRSAETSATRERSTVSGVEGVAPGGPILYSGDIFLDPQVRIGVYEQEIDERYLSDPLEKAIEKLYMSRDLSISDTKIRQLLADYLFTDADRMTPLARLSGGQKARFQIIAMLANDPQLLVLDEPTNHLGFAEHRRAGNGVGQVFRRDSLRQPR